MCMGVWSACVSAYRVDAEVEEAAESLALGIPDSLIQKYWFRQGCVGGGVLTEVQ